MFNQTTRNLLPLIDVKKFPLNFKKKNFAGKIKWTREPALNSKNNLWAIVRFLCLTSLAALLGMTNLPHTFSRYNEHLVKK